MHEIHESVPVSSMQLNVPFLLNDRYYRRVLANAGMGKAQIEPITRLGNRWTRDLKAEPEIVSDDTMVYSIAETQA